jgi:peptidoglycan/LPS O-acetylase OafA/YrhL
MQLRTRDAVTQGAVASPDLGALVQPSGYIPALDGLRAVSILLVVLSHFGFQMVPGIFGVTIFFFISGYLIAGQLLQEIGRTGHIALGGFYMRRALRLYPALMVAVVIGGGAFALLGGLMTVSDVMSALFYFANYHDLFGGNQSGLPGAGHPFGVLWSLAVEEHYYLAFPLVALLFGRNRLRFAIVIGLAILAITAWRVEATALCRSGVLACSGIAQLRIEHGTDTRADSILYGALLAVLAAGPTRESLLWLLRARWSFVSGVAMLLVALAIRNDWFRDTFRFTLQGIGLFLCIGGLLFNRRVAPLCRIAAWKPLVLVGRWSYSLYLWHWIVYVMAGVLLPAWLWEPVMHPSIPPAYWLVTVLPLLLLLSFGTAMLSYYYVETPMLALRRRFGSHTVADMNLGDQTRALKPRLPVLAGGEPGTVRD